MQRYSSTETNTEYHAIQCCTIQICAGNADSSSQHDTEYNKCNTVHYSTTQIVQATPARHHKYRIQMQYSTLLYNANCAGSAESSSQNNTVYNKCNTVQYVTVQHKSCRQHQLVIRNKYRIQMQYSTVLYNTNCAGSAESS